MTAAAGVILISDPQKTELIDEVLANIDSIYLIAIKK